MTGEGRELSRFLRNTLFTQLGGVLPALLGLIALPLLLRNVGHIPFGAWVAVLASINAVAAFDLGLSSTVTKAVAERGTTRDGSAGRAVRTAFTVTLLMGVVSAGVVMATVGPIVRGLGAGEEGLEVVRWSAGITAFSWFVVSYASWVLMGLGRFGVASLLSGMVATLRTLLGLGAALGGLGLPGLAGAHAIAGVVMGVGAIVVTRRIAGPGLRIGLELSMPAIREHGAFSVSSFLQILGATFALDTLPVYLAGAHFGPAGLLTFYVGQRVASIAGRALASAGSVLFTDAAEIGDDPAAQELLLRRGTRWMVHLAAPLFVVLFLFAPALLTVWLRELDPAVTTMVRLLVGSTLVIACGEAAYCLLWVRRVHYVTVVTLTALAVGAGVAFATIGSLGVSGVAVGVLAYGGASTLLVLVGAARLTGGVRAGLTRALASVVVPSLGAAATALGLQRLVPVRTFPELALEMAVAGGVYIALFLLAAAPDERRALRALMSRGGVDGEGAPGAGRVG